MKKKFLKFLPIALCATLAVSCSDSDNSEPGGNGGDDNSVESAYVLSGVVNSANYILTSETLSDGEVTVKNNGLEADDAAYWIYFNNKYLYRLAYNQGEAGVSSSYTLQTSGKLKERSKVYEIKRFTSYGMYDNLIITSSTGDMTKTDENGYHAKGFLFNELNVENETLLPVDAEITSEDYLGTGEYVTLAGYQQVGKKVFTAPIPMGLSQFGVKADSGKHVIYPDLVKTESGGTNSSSYLKDELQWTQYPDQAWIAIYPSLDFTQKPKLIKTEKISYATGRFKSQYYQTMWATSNGDIYVFSPSYAKTMTDARQKTKLPAGVVRIAAGTEDFDDYYCDIEALSGGKSFMRCWYVSDNYFLMQMYDKPLTETGFQALELAIFNAATKELKTISGIPSASEITAIGSTPYMENGVAYVPITTTTGKPAVYKVDVKTATASVGLLMDATQISSIGKLIATK